MFGQSASPFGSPAGTSTFGGGGAQTGQTTFGATSTFGSPAPAPNAFGGGGAFGSPAPAPAPSGFGAFGAAAPAPAPAGGFTGFGAAPAPASTFGQASAAPTPFGSPAPAPGGMFGGGANTTNTFGAPSQPSGFGTTNTAGGFGQTQTNTTSPFAAPAPSTGGGLFGGGGTTSTFGAPAPAPSAFGTTNTAFGAPTPAPAAGGGLFGAAPAAAPSAGFGGFGAANASTAPNMFGAPSAAGKPGSAAVAYQVTQKSDGATSINLQTITAMPQYEAKSPEELRLEDYMAGNKGSMGQAQPPGAAPAFGAAPAPAAASFGSAPAPASAFGGGAFGSPAPAPATGAFGGFGPAPAPAAGFGGGAFGAAAAPKPGGLFGQPAPAPATGGLFGSTPAPAPAAGFGGGAFGAAPAPAAPAAGGLFGSPPAAPVAAPAGGGLFGQPAPAPAGGGLFGQPAPAPATGALFGSTPAPAPAAGFGGGAFGAAPAPAAPAAGGLFGSPPAAPAAAPAGGGLFGQPAPAPAGGGLFGQPAPAPATGGLFGSTPAPAAGSLFGGQPAAAPATTGSLFGSAPAPAPSLFGSAQPVQPPAPVAATVAPPPTADALLAQQLAAVENQKKELALLEPWRGQTSAGSSVIPTSLSEREAIGQGAIGGGDVSNRSSSYAASSGLFLSYQAAPRSAAKIRPRGFAPVKSPAALGSVGKMGAGSASPLISPDTYLGSSAKRLVIKPGSLTPKPKMRLLLTDGNGDEKKDDATYPISTAGTANSGVHRESPAPSRPADPGVNTPSSTGFTSPMAASANAGRGMTSPPSGGGASAATGSSPAQPATPSTSDDSKSGRSPSTSRKDKSGGAAYDFYQRIVGSPGVNGSTPTAASSGTPSFIPKLTKAGGYKVQPTLSVMANMSEADLAAVSDFKVSRDGFGSIAWEGAVDVRGVDLDSVVSIESRDVAVYDEEEENGTKPPVGSKLNRPAIITMYGIFPKDGGENASEEARGKMEKKIAKSTKKMGAELISYSATTGEWKFRVKHFSRYGLSDEDDSDDDGEEQEVAIVAGENVAPSNIPAQPSRDFEARGRGGWPREEAEGKEKDRRSRIRAPLDEDEEMSATTDGEESSTGALTSEGEGFPNVDGGGSKEMEAYAFLSSQMTTEADPGIVDGTTFQEIEQPANFPDEGVSTGQDHNPRPPVDKALPVIAACEGISAKIARKCGISKPTSSSTDFGLRMGRSFRVGWRPDGSFVFPRPSAADASDGCTMTLCQQRPAIGAVEDSVPLLQVHLKNSVNVEDSSVADCPTYSLPKAVESQSSSGSYEALCSTLDDYSDASKKGEDNMVSDPEVPKVVPRAFSLLSALYAQENAVVGGACEPSVSNERRSEGIKLWLRDAVSHDMMEAINLSVSQGDSLQGIFDALSGGNIFKASEMAISQGHLRLATLLSSSDVQTREDLRSQMQDMSSSPRLPMSLRRIYALLGGDDSIEENLYSSGSSPSSNLDWRRRLALRCLFSSDNQSLPTILAEYRAGIAERLVPPAIPRHAQRLEQDECILFQMLQIWAIASRSSDDSRTALSDVINPLTHTVSEHDFSMSFHLASAVSAIGCCLPLSTTGEATLIDSYVHQLLGIGLWEWAVYVCICCCSSYTASSELSELWKQRAMDIVMRFYPSEKGSGDGIIMPQRRAFLHNTVGIPNSWFAMALADRSLYSGEALKYVHSIAEFSKEEAVQCFEDQLLPTILFNGSPKDESILSYLESDCVYESNSIARKLVDLTQEVLSLSKQQQQQQQRQMPNQSITELQYFAAELQQQIQDESSSLSPANSNAYIVKDEGSIPLSVFNAEASTWVAFLQLQLVALGEGHSVFDDDSTYGPAESTRFKHASQLSHLTSTTRSSADTVQPFLGSTDFLRGKYGIA